MPFHDYASLSECHGQPPPGPATLLRWHTREGDYIEAGTQIASLEVGGASHTFSICFPARIEKLLATEGSTIQPDQSILRWIADGENIPYGKAPLFRCDPEV